jgi:predicted HicB family RNase H-like nuclease|tara:strand:+ start:391 stop:537 length:147 start_codon:yes stop_codon:yes gene_type:complete
MNKKTVIIRIEPNTKKYLELKKRRTGKSVTKLVEHAICKVYRIPPKNE